MPSAVAGREYADPLGEGQQNVLLIRFKGQSQAAEHSHDDHCYLAVWKTSLRGSAELDYLNPHHGIFDIEPLEAVEL